MNQITSTLEIKLEIKLNLTFIDDNGFPVKDQDELFVAADGRVVSMTNTTWGPVIVDIPNVSYSVDLQVISQE